MPSRSSIQKKLLDELVAVTKQLDEVLKDLEWRKPDVEAEEASLRLLMEQAKKDAGVDVASQAIAVRVLRSVLDDKIAEAERLEEQMLQIQGQLEAEAESRQKPVKGDKRGKTIRKKT